MSISSEISRLQEAKDDIKTSIENKGVTVPSSAKIDTYNDYIDQISGGGEVPEKVVFFFDYEGTLLYSYTGEEIQALSALPSAADHSTDEVPLTFDEWNWTLAEIKSYNTSYPEADINVGALYHPTDGKTHYILEIPELYDGASYTFTLNVDPIQRLGNTIISWGDGTTDSVSSTSVVNHNYPAYGRYHCTIENSLLATITPDLKIANRVKDYVIEAYIAQDVASNPNNALAFTRDHNLQKVVLPASYGKFNNEQFRYCTNLIHVNRPKVVNPSFLSNYEFSDCISLKRVCLPPTIDLNTGAFNNCYSLESITLPLSQTVAESFLRSCKSLKKVIVPSTYTSIGNSAFTGSGIIKVILPSNLTSLGNYAFEQCISLRKIEIPSSVTSLGSGVFSNCHSLEEVIMSGVTTINSNAFLSCENLKRLNLSNVTSFPTNTWLSYSKIESVTFNENLTTTPGFGGCYLSQLKNVTLPSSATSIGSFSGCTSLTELTLPHGVTTLGGSFLRDTSITSFTIPDTVTVIPERCFYGALMTSLIIHENITEIGNWSLYNSSIEALICFPTTPPVAQSNSLYNNELDYIYVPWSADHSVLAAYQSASNWSSYASKMIEMPEPQS